MICRAYLQKLMKTLLGNGSSSSFTPYIALFKLDPTLNSSGYYVMSGEPETSKGYQRYVYSYTFDTTVQDTIVAYNTNTIYFDEATADWTSDAALKYFGLCESSTASNCFAYGELLDGDGNPTTILVNKGQLPIIRKNMLKIQFSENVAPKYSVTLRAGENEGAVEISRIGLYAFPSLSTFADPGQTSMRAKITELEEALPKGQYEPWDGTWIKSGDSSETPTIYHAGDALAADGVFVPYFVKVQESQE
jgi:hypothetical protein